MADPTASPTEVRGTVRLMTERPVELPVPSASPSLWERAAYQRSRRPWLIPAALLGAAALVLLVRRR